MKKTTESISKYDHLEKMETNDLLININKDKSVADCVQELFLTLKTLSIYHRMKNGGRLFYIGAGTSGIWHC